MRVRYSALFLACLSLLGVSAFTAAQSQQMPSAAGLWQQIDDVTGESDGWFIIYESNGVYEGAIAKMFFKPGENPNPICFKCRGEQHNKPSLGLTIIKNMHRDGLKYENGTILDPRDGNIYNALMELSPDGQNLTVRGYLGISLFGRNQIWRRLPNSALAQVDRSVIATHAPALLPGSAKPRALSPGQQRSPLVRGQVR